MSVISTPTADLAAPAHGHGTNYLNHSRGFWSWALTLDHKRIGLMYMAAVLSFFFVGGVFAMLLRTELIKPGPTLFNDPAKAWDFYNHMFTLHGAVMVFLFIIPAVPAILGNFVLPMMLGAKDVAFPRLNLLSYYVYVAGALFFLYILISGVVFVSTGVQLPGGYGLDTGWTFYTPYSSNRSAGGVIPATLGAFTLGFSSILTGVNFIASIHTLRPKGMGWFDMPLFLWGLYATSIIQILATPVLAITLLLLCMERWLHVGIFDPALGGDPVLFQHFFWFYSHPAVYIMILPAMGIISELIATFSHKHIFGYRFIAYSSLAIALLGFLVWGHHMFTSGQSVLANTIFSVITFTIAVPSAIKVFNWLTTLYKGQIHLTTPMLYALGFIWMFSIGGLTGLFLGAISVDVHLQDTYFVVAHFHYVMVGSMLFAFIGGMNYWFPKMFGKMYNENLGRFAAVLLFIGFNLTFFIQFIMGSHGMPRRYADYAVRFAGGHMASTIGAYIMGISLVLVLINWVHALFAGKPAPANPWGSNTLEWDTPSPPPHDNFPVAPVVTDPYDMDRWKFVSQEEGWVLTEEAKAALAAGTHRSRVAH
jgi:cytochrome c oxidase subunit I